MNEQLPPIDSDLREHLARRSAGRLPGELAAEVFTALDSAPIRRPIWRVPRLAVAGLSLALVAVLVVAIAFSAVRTPPAASAPSLAGYPAERALTTAELASLMAGPPLPVNTALVASVTIDVRNDVCPMNRYQTQGLVEGMGSQVCVMTADVAVQPTTLTGTFAFRYLAPGYLGMLGGIAPASSASSRLALQVADSWPDTGGTFLVDGWLGAVELTASCAGAPTTGDVLAPNGEDCPYDNWLGDGLVAAGIVADHEYTASSPQQSYDPLSLRGNARHVEAGGMRLIDSIDHAAPVRGTYVVRPVTGPCPGAEPQASRGCNAWRVLAKVAEISVPPPRGTQVEAATAAPTTAPPATPLVPALTGVIGTGNQPLTADELETLMVNRPDHLAGRIVIIEAPIPTQISCQSDANGGGCAVNTKPLAQTGIWAVSIGAEGALRLVGQITTPIGRGVVARGYVFTLDEVNASASLKAGDLVVVDGWLVEHVVTCNYDATPLPAGCGPFSEIASMATDNSPASVFVQQGAFEEFTGSAGDWTIDGPPVHGLYLIRLQSVLGGTLLARLEAPTP
jgi:hypothetical protein